MWLRGIMLDFMYSLETSIEFPDYLMSHLNLNFHIKHFQYWQKKSDMKLSFNRDLSWINDSAYLEVNSPYSHEAWSTWKTVNSEN